MQKKNVNKSYARSLLIVVIAMACDVSARMPKVVDLAVSFTQFKKK